MQTNHRLIQLQTFIGNMPQLPPTITRVLEICNNVNTSANELNRVISLDPVLTGKVLRLVNSAYYGLSRQIHSLVRAIIMLGMNTVKNLVLSTAVISQMKRRSHFRALNMVAFWQHCLAVGVTAKLIASLRGKDTAVLEEYFIAGLLHDIGKIPLNTLFDEDYIAVLIRAEDERIPLYQAEQELLGMDHAQVGQMVFTHWNLKNEIAEPAIWHHSLETYAGIQHDILHTVALANLAVNTSGLGLSGDIHPEAPRPATEKWLGLGLTELESARKDIEREIRNAQVFLKM